jgi:hypothetical protein
MAGLWSADELTELERLTGDYPWAMVMKKYNAWAATNGYDQRTALALERRVNMLSLSRRAEGEWITIGAVSVILGIDREKPRRWLMRGKLRSYRCSDRRPSPHYVSRHDLRAWAKREPEFFRPYSWDSLVLLFDSTHAANFVYEHPPVTPKRYRRAVLCVETGQSYSSITEAAQRNYVTISRMHAIINTDEKAMGRHFVDAALGYRIFATK